MTCAAAAAQPRNPSRRIAVGSPPIDHKKGVVSVLFKVVAGLPSRSGMVGLCVDPRTLIGPWSLAKVDPKAS